VRAFPTWNGRSSFAHIKPDAGAVTASWHESKRW
jgi:hypothetical protein